MFKEKTLITSLLKAGLILVGVFVVFVVSTTFTTKYSMRHENRQSQETLYLTNTKQIAKSITLYASDYQDHLPPNLESEQLMLSTYPYTKNTKLFDYGQHSQLTGAPNAEGKNLKKCLHPEKEIILYTAPEIELRNTLFTKKKVIFVILANGEIAKLTNNEFQKAKANNFVLE